MAIVKVQGDGFWSKASFPLLIESGTQVTVERMAPLRKEVELCLGFVFEEDCHRQKVQRE